MKKISFKQNNLCYKNYFRNDFDISSEHSYSQAQVIKLNYHY